MVTRSHASTSAPDAPGILHHVMVRGLERRPIFRDNVDQRDFLTRLGGLVEATTLNVMVGVRLDLLTYLSKGLS